jgi:hypothetical protein
MGWFSQWASAISGESAENSRRREESREALDRDDARLRAITKNNEAESRRSKEN